MEKRFLISIIVIIALIIIGLSLYYFLGPGKKYVVYQKAVAGLSGNEAILVVDNGQQERMFKGEIAEGMTVANVLEAASLAGNFDYQGASWPASNASRSDAGWHCLLNGKEVSDRVADETVHPKDKIVCRYQ